MKTTLMNWTEMRELEIVAGEPHGEIPALVSLRTYGGSMSFQFDMTAEQARGMADDLLNAADAVDAFSSAEMNCEVGE